MEHPSAMDGGIVAAPPARRKAGIDGRERWRQWDVFLLFAGRGRIFRIRQAHSGLRDAETSGPLVPGKQPEKIEKGEARLPPLYWAAFVLSGDWR